MHARRGIPTLFPFVLVFLAGPVAAGFWADPELKDIFLDFTGDRVTMKAGSFVPSLVIARAPAAGRLPHGLPGHPGVALPVPVRPDRAVGEDPGRLPAYLGTVARP